MAYRAKLEKLQTLEGGKVGDLRTDTIEGLVLELPRKGKNFQLFSEPLDSSMDLRVVTTSQVQAIEYFDSKLVFFKTENSKYSLHILEET